MLSAHLNITEIKDGVHLFHDIVSPIDFDIVRSNTKRISSLQLDPTLVTVIRAYIPTAILPKLDEGHSEWLAEFRKITVLFISLPLSS